MKLAITVAIAALTAGQAQALSCMRTDPIAAFAKAQSAPEPYIVLLGKAEFADGRLPAMRDGNAPVGPVAAQFEGVGLGADGFTVPFDADVTLNPSCAGPWCGGLEAGQQVIAFARVDGGDTVIDLTPCAQWVFTDPAPQVIADVAACLNTQCSAQTLQ